MIPRIRAVLILCVLASGCAGHAITASDDALTIRLKQDGAGQVFFLHSADGFKRHPAEKSKDQWIVRIPFHARFRYFYLIDGRVVVPDCPCRETDDFGSENCIYVADL